MYYVMTGRIYRRNKDYFSIRIAYPAETIADAAVIGSWVGAAIGGLGRSFHAEALNEVPNIKHSVAVPYFTFSGTHGQILEYVEATKEQVESFVKFMREE